jgi:hypothetical protein
LLRKSSDAIIILTGNEELGLLQPTDFIIETPAFN